MNFAGIKGRLNNEKLPARLLAGFLVLILLVSLVLAANMIGDTYGEPDDLQPGTPEYYDARWADAKEQAGWKDGNDDSRILTPGPWNMEIVGNSNCSAPWDGTVSSMNNSNTASGAAYHANTNPYLVYTAEQFRWCVTNGRAFRLMNNIDLNGYSGEPWGKVGTTWGAVTLDGNGYTVYNCYINLPTTNIVSVFGIASNTNFIMKNLTLSNSYIEGLNFTCSLINFLGGRLEQVYVENSLVLGYRSSAFVTSDGYSSTATGVITQCGTKNAHIYGKKYSDVSSCVSGFVQHPPMTLSITNCYAVDGSVVSTGGHSSGILGCGGASVTINSVFSNIDVYANNETGSFIGAHHGNVTASNCYASGKIEGVDVIGGFIATQQGRSSGTQSARINNCYSTSMVGLMENSKSVGGFVGGYDRRMGTDYPGKSMYFEDCYAAGEVGAIGTNVSSDRGTTNRSTGGFAGHHSGTTTMTYKRCFYDKQTTAMREWAMGYESGSTGGFTSDQLQTPSLVGNYNVKGVLTTDTDKSGTGLTSAPSSNTASDNTTNQSFTGFSNNALWIYEDGYYPQLAVFANATAAAWGSAEKAEMVKAYSKASASTVQLETYDKDYAGNTISNKAVYDTVRDLTQRFPLTSKANIKWKRVGNTNNLPTGDGNKTELYGQNYDILKLSGEDYGDEYWGYDFAPGIDWLQVDAKVGNQVGNRRLRIIPTMNIEAGYSTVVAPGHTYNHARDMRMAYSTGPRMATEPGIYTFGVYPDNPLDIEQEDLLNSDQSKYKGVPPSVATDDDTYFNANALYMERTGGTLSSPTVPTPTAATGGKINEVKIQPVTATNPDGSLQLGAAIDLTDPNSSAAKQWNGKEAFDTSQTGEQYVITYYWSLSDGRYMSHGKLVSVDDKTTHDVSIAAQVPDGTQNPNYAYLDAYNIADEFGDVDSSLTYDFGTDTRGKDILTGQNQGFPAATSWKAMASNWRVKKVTVTFTPDDVGSMEELVPKTVTLTGDQIPTEPGSKESFYVDMPQIALRLNSDGNYEEYFTVIRQKYELKLGNDGVYTINFAGTHSDGQYGAYIRDVNQHIDVVVVLSPPDGLEFTVATPDDAKYTGGDKQELQGKNDFLQYGAVAVQPDTNPVSPGSRTYGRARVPYNNATRAVWLPDGNYSTGNVYVTMNEIQTQVYLKPDGTVYTTPTFTDGTAFNVRVDDTQNWTGFTMEPVKWDTVTVNKKEITRLVFPGVTEEMHVDVSFRLNTTGFNINKTLTEIAEEEEVFLFQIEYRGNDTLSPGNVERTMYARIEIKAGEIAETVSFKNIPVGWYTVTELDSNWRFELDGDALENDNQDATVDKQNGSVTNWVGK